MVSAVSITVSAKIDAPSDGSVRRHELRPVGDRASSVERTSVSISGSTSSKKNDSSIPIRNGMAGWESCSSGRSRAVVGGRRSREWARADHDRRSHRASARRPARSAPARPHGPGSMTRDSSRACSPDRTSASGPRSRTRRRGSGSTPRYPNRSRPEGHAGGDRDGGPTARAARSPSRSPGLRQIPKCGFSVVTPSANSWRLVLPSRTAPCSLRRSTTPALWSGHGRGRWRSPSW